MDQPGKVANSAWGQLNRESYISLSAFAPQNLVSRDRFGSQSRPASACSSPYPGWIWCLLTGFLPSSTAASIYLFKTAIRHRVSSELSYIGSSVEQQVGCLSLRKIIKSEEYSFGSFSYISTLSSQEGVFEARPKLNPILVSKERAKSRARTFRFLTKEPFVRYSDFSLDPRKTTNLKINRQ